MAQMTITQFMTGIKNWVLGKIENITALIPSQASSSNQLADKAFVNSSIATATATFQGTYNVVSDLSLSYNATHAQIQTALGSAISTPDNNDYAFVQIPTADATPTQIAKIERYKYSGSAWAFEYELNNSGFTAAQWAAINSGATLELIGKLSDLPTNAELTELLAAKQNVIQDLADIRSGATAGATAVQPATLNTALSNTVAESGVYDVTANNDNAKFASLSALLSSENLDTLIPTAKRKGGMSIKFVLSSDNKYVQFRYMSSSTAVADFTNVANWQGVNSEVVAGSKNLITSTGAFGGIADTVGNYVPIKKSLLTESGWSESGYKLRPSGLKEADANAKLAKYAVSSLVGKYIKLELSKDHDCVFQFQNNREVTTYANPYLIEKPYLDAINGIVKVPTGATYLIISQAISNTTNAVYQCYNGIDDMPTASSENLVTSAGVFTNISETVGDYVPLKTTLLQKSGFSKTGYKLLASGSKASDANAELAIYGLSSLVGKYIKLILSKDHDCVFQFQNNRDVPTGTNTYLVGKPYLSAINGIVKVPVGATYLIVSQDISNTTNSVSSCNNAIDDAPTKDSKNLVTSGGVKAELIPLELLSDRIHCIITDFVNQSVLVNGVPTYNLSFYRTNAIEVLDAKRIYNLSNGVQGLCFYRTNELTEESFIEYNTTGLVPDGAKYFAFSKSATGGVAPASVTYDVDSKAQKDVNDLTDYVNAINKALTGNIIIPKADMRIGKAIDANSSETRGNIINADPKFYLSPTFYVGGVKKIQCDNADCKGFHFYSSSNTNHDTYLGSYYSDKENKVPNGAQYCIANFYNVNNNSQGSAVPATTIVLFNEPDRKTCLFIGDSLSTNVAGWKVFLEEHYGLHYVRNATPATPVEQHQAETSDDDLWPADGGIRVTPPETESEYNYAKSIWYRCANNRMDIYKFDCISLLGGQNDMSLPNFQLGTVDDKPYKYGDKRPENLTFASALKGCISMLWDTYHKPIFLCTVFPSGSSQTNVVDAEGVRLSERMALLQMQIANYYRAERYIDVTAVPFYWDMRNALTWRIGVLSRDTVHANDAWDRRMATIFAETYPLQLQVGITGKGVITD